MATIRGTRDLKRAKIVHSTSGLNDPRQMRCPSCTSSLCQSVSDGKGGVVIRCTSCRSEFSSRRI